MTDIGIRSSTWSRYTHMVERNGSSFLFNSLSLATIELDDDDSAEALAVAPGAPVPPDLSPSELGLLREHGFIVDEPEDEGEAINRLTALRATAAQSRPARVGFARISLTERCNMACSYCFQQQMFADYQPTMTSDVLDATLARLVDQAEGGPLAIQYFGGEPLLRYRMIRRANRFLERARDEGRISSIYQTLTTNGTLLTSEAAAFFIEKGFAIVFSLDGWEAINDEHRVFKTGHGTHAAVLDAIRTYRDAGGPVSILLTSTRETLDRLPSVVRYLVESDEVGAHEVGINAPQPRADGWDVGGEVLARTIQECWSICRAADVRFYGPGAFIPEVLRDQTPQFDRCIEGTPGAASGEWPVYVAADGSTSYCVVHHQDPRCTDHDVTHLDLPRVRRWHYDQRADQTCDGCIASQICGGPCSLELLLWQGRLHPDRCGFFREMTRWAIAQ